MAYKSIGNKKGFTLIELIMVIVILGILAATALPKYFDLKKEAERSTAHGVTASLQGAISALYSRALLQNISYTLGDVVENAQISGVPVSTIESVSEFQAKIGATEYKWTYEQAQIPSVSGKISEASGW